MSLKTLTLSESGLIFEEIKKANHVLLHCHTSADGDSVGSALGLMHILTGELGKKVTIVQSDTPVPHYLSFLPGFETIVQKNFNELDLSPFDLFIILDTASPDKISHMHPISFPMPIKTICIDHHASNVGYADMNMIVPEYPATCQILADILWTWGIEISREAALCFFTGMYTDTGGFKYPGTSTKSFAIAAFLTEKAPDFVTYLSILENSHKKDQMWAKKIFFNTLETWFNDSVAVTTATHEQLVDAGVNPVEASGSDMASMLKSVVGWEIGIAMAEQRPGVFKVSFRARDDGHAYDLSKMIVTLGGGGHKGAAGATVSGTLEEVKEKVKSALAESFPELTR